MNDQEEKNAGTDFNADEIIRFGYKEEENAFAVFKRLTKTLKSDNDVIVGNDGFEIKMVATMRLKNPAVYIMHGDFPYYYSILKDYGAVIDKVICYSNKIEQESNKILSLSGKVASKIYYPAAVADTKILDIPHKQAKFKIVFAGLVIERKGADLLPAIYEGLIDKGVKDFELEIMGEGELLPTLKQTLLDRTQVKFAGWSDAVYLKEQMRKAHVFLFPSRLEGLANVLVEALAARAVPVVTRLESGVTDFLEDGVNALLIECNDVDGFVSGLVRLYQNPNLLECLRSNAAESLKIFEPHTQAKLYQHTIEQISISSLGHKRVFPPYVRGRLLDRSWIPASIVKVIRRLVNNPKL
ncbi:MAG: glycosyltransferase [Sphingobacteriales bacterium]|nr:MAG: glycosyltransferase [Sphingobacteriales bacterium]